MPTATDPSQGGTIELKGFSWQTTGDATTDPTDAQYQGGVEPAAGSDNFVEYTTRFNIESLNYEIGQNDAELSNLDDRVTALESDISDLQTSFSNHTHDSRYYTKTQSDDRFLTPSEGDTRYYTRTAADDRFLTPTEGDARYYTQSAADDRFVNTDGDSMSGPLTMNADLHVGTIRGPTNNGFIAVQGSDIEGDTGAQYNWEQKAEQPLRVWDRSTGTSFFDVTRAGGASFGGGEVDASKTDWIVLSDRDANSPAPPADGKVRLGGRADRA